MQSATVVVSGIVKSDGTLELLERVRIAPGPVHVTVTSQSEQPQSDPFWQMLDEIWKDQKARGRVDQDSGQSQESLRQLRDEWEQRSTAISNMQDDARRRREQGA